MQVVSTLSCWSKYVNRTTECPKLEDGKEEENIYTERDQFRTQGTRKRQLDSKLKVVGGHYGNFTDKEPWIGCQCINSQPHQTLSWNTGCFSKYHHNNSPKKVLCTSTHPPSCPQAFSSYHTASTSYSYTMASCSKSQYNSSHDQPGVQVSKHLKLNNGPSAPLSNQKFAESKLGNKASKWSKFLSVVQEDHVEGNFSQSALIDNTMVSESTGTLTDINSQEHRNPPAVKIDTGVPRKQNHYVAGKSSYQNSHMLTSEPTSSQKPICNQPPLTKILCPGFSLNPLFFTNDDFDDTI